MHDFTRTWTCMWPGWLEQYQNNILCLTLWLCSHFFFRPGWAEQSHIDFWRLVTHVGCLYCSLLLTLSEQLATISWAPALVWLQPRHMYDYSYVRMAFVGHKHIHAAATLSATPQVHSTYYIFSIFLSSNTTATVQLSHQSASSGGIADWRTRCAMKIMHNERRLSLVEAIARSMVLTFNCIMNKTVR